VLTTAVLASICNKTLGQLADACGENHYEYSRLSTTLTNFSQYFILRIGAKQFQGLINPLDFVLQEARNGCMKMACSETDA